MDLLAHKFTDLSLRSELAVWIKANDIPKYYNPQGTGMFYDHGLLKYFNIGELQFINIKILLRHDRGVILGKINGIFKAKFLFLLFFDSMTFLILRYFFENQERDVEIQIVSTTFSVFMCRKWIITNTSSIFLSRFYTGILCAQPILCPLYKSHIYGSFNNSLFFLIIIF